MNAEAAKELYAQEVERHLLALRETLVRFDENLKAWQLLEVAPYIVTDRPAIVAARRDQYEMVKHVFDPDREYAAYYASNVHEAPFEQQYGIQPESAHEHLHRVAFLRAGLERQATRRGASLRVLDLGCNDGWMAANLLEVGHVVDGVDLNPDNITRAQQRGLPGTFTVGAAEEASGGPYAAVVAFEVVEHVADPHALLEAMVAVTAPGGRIYLSTPNGAVEGGNLPTWAHVEPKGHVRSLRVTDFRQLLETAGAVEDLQLGPDGVLVACVDPAR